MRVLIAVRKNILTKIVIDNQTDLVSHLYYLILNIKELHPCFGKVLKRTRVVNLYDNKVGRGQLWERSSPTIRRVIQDISWRHIIKGRVLVVGDMKAYCIM